MDGREIGREEFFLNGGSLYDYYKTKDGQYMSFGGLEPHFLKLFVKPSEEKILIPGGCVRQDAAAVKEEIREIIKTKTRDEWVEVFKNIDACFEPVLSVGEAFSSEHVIEREMVVEVPSPDGHTVKQIGCPIKFSEPPLSTAI